MWHLTRLILRTRPLRRLGILSFLIAVVVFSYAQAVSTINLSGAMRIERNFGTATHVASVDVEKIATGSLDVSAFVQVIEELGGRDVTGQVVAAEFPCDGCDFVGFRAAEWGKNPLASRLMVIDGGWPERQNEVAVTPEVADIGSTLTVPHGPLLRVVGHVRDRYATTVATVFGPLEMVEWEDMATSLDRIALTVELRWVGPPLSQLADTFAQLVGGEAPAVNYGDVRPGEEREPATAIFRVFAEGSWAVLLLPCFVAGAVGVMVFARTLARSERQLDAVGIDRQRFAVSLIIALVLITATALFAALGTAYGLAALVSRPILSGLVSHPLSPLRLLPSPAQWSIASLFLGLGVGWVGVRQRSAVAQVKSMWSQRSHIIRRCMAVVAALWGIRVAAGASPNPWEYAFAFSIAGGLLAPDVLIILQRFGTRALHRRLAVESLKPRSLTTGIFVAAGAGVLAVAGASLAMVTTNFDVLNANNFPGVPRGTAEVGINDGEASDALTAKIAAVVDVSDPVVITSGTPASPAVEGVMWLFGKSGDAARVVPGGLNEDQARLLDGGDILFAAGHTDSSEGRPTIDLPPELAQRIDGFALASSPQVIVEASQSLFYTDMTDATSVQFGGRLEAAGLGERMLILWQTPDPYSIPWLLQLVLAMLVIACALLLTGVLWLRAGEMRGKVALLRVIGVGDLWRRSVIRHQSLLLAASIVLPALTVAMTESLVISVRIDGVHGVVVPWLAIAFCLAMAVVSVLLARVVAAVRLQTSEARQARR